MDDEVLYEGEVILPTVLNEGGFDELHCNPPVKFRYAVYKSNQYNAIVEFEFGLQTSFNINPKLSFNRHYAQATEDSTAESIITAHVIFELFHSFCHPDFDPNYSHLNWALKGWLKGQITVKEIPLTSD